ncbi:unnamed protein product [Urochloa humidicola]
MEEDWEIGEDEWVEGEIIAPAEEEVSPPSYDQDTAAISHPTPPMEEELEIGEHEWAIGDLEAPGGRESPPPPLSHQATNAISLPTLPPMEEDWAIWEEDRAIGELEAPGGRDESPPLPPGVYVDEGYATAAAAEAAATAALIRNKRGRVPASSKAIEGLREVTAPPTDDDRCAICLHDFDSRRDPVETPPPSELRLRAMPCSHTFHEHCIFKWLRRNTACPLCRHQLPMEEEVDEEEQARRSRSRSFTTRGTAGTMSSRTSGSRLWPTWRRRRRSWTRSSRGGGKSTRRT